MVAVRASRRDEPWSDACSFAALAALLAIAAAVALSAVTASGLPYASGGAVVLGLGAVLSSAIRGPLQRQIAAGTIALLLVFRLVAGAWPASFIPSHGPIEMHDAAATVVLIVVACSLWLAAHTPPDADGD